MSKSSLRILAVLLTAGIIVVLFAGLDGLPRDVKAQIAAGTQIAHRRRSRRSNRRRPKSRAISRARAPCSAPCPRRASIRTAWPRGRFAGHRRPVSRRARTVGKTEPARGPRSRRIAAGAREAGARRGRDRRRKRPQRRRPLDRPQAASAPGSPGHGARLQSDPCRGSGGRPRPPYRRPRPTGRRRRAIWNRAWPPRAPSGRAAMSCGNPARRRAARRPPTITPRSISARCSPPPTP